MFEPKPNVIRFRFAILLALLLSISGKANAERLPIRNASTTKPAKFVVFLVKKKDAPVLVPVN